MHCLHIYDGDSICHAADVMCSCTVLMYTWHILILDSFCCTPVTGQWLARTASLAHCNSQIQTDKNNIATTQHFAAENHARAVLFDYTSIKHITAHDVAFNHFPPHAHTLECSAPTMLLPFSGQLYTLHTVSPHYYLSMWQGPGFCSTRPLHACKHTTLQALACLALAWWVDVVIHT